MDQGDLTYWEVRAYLDAAVIFTGSIAVLALAYGHARAGPAGSAGLLLVIPVAAVAATLSIAGSAAAGPSARRPDLPFCWPRDWPLSGNYVPPDQDKLAVGPGA